jgi:trans-aconitate 2-methyltransferase
VPLDWDAATYDRISDPAARWGREVLERLHLRGDETVLDAGCGTGRVTVLLLNRLPDGHVVGMDASAAMLREARRRLEAYRDRLFLVRGDLLRPLPFTLVDAVFSTATFHWIADHDALFHNLAQILKPDGQLVAQCGGAGNLAAVRAALRDLGIEPAPKTFATPEQTSRRLVAAGFGDVQAWLDASPTPLEPGPQLETYLRTIPLRMELQGVEPAERDVVVREVVRRLPRPEIDYVRLNITARRGTGR